MQEAVEKTAESLRWYGRTHQHWAIAYSGGKDSTAVVTLVVWLIESGQVPAPKTITVLYADTRMELPPLHGTAMNLLDSLHMKHGVDTRIVLPEMDKRFFVYMLGRGVPPPKNRFRWCTGQIKVKPMELALRDMREAIGEKFLMLTGVRIGESAARDSRISLSCSRDGAECGQGWFQETMPEDIADTLAPLLHWRVCHVWDWLMFDAPTYGFPTAPVATVYGGDEAIESNCRTGCVGCNLTSRDHSLEMLLRKFPEYTYLEPLMGLRPLYAELIKPHNRLRKISEFKQDGTPVKNLGRLGPLTMDARRYALKTILDIQTKIEQHRPADLAGIVLIDPEEDARIRHLIEADTWPNRWDGTEQTGDAEYLDTNANGLYQAQLFPAPQEAN